MEKQKIKLECEICGRLMIQGPSYKRYYNSECKHCRKIVRKKGGK